MTAVGPFPVGWVAATSPLRPVAVAASGAAARQLLRRALVRAARELTGVATADTVLLLGEANELPWVEGVVYLGRHPDAAGVLWPTALHPTVPVDLLAAALRARVPAGELPVAVLPGAGPTRLVPLGAARPLDAATVAEWLRSPPR